MGRVVVYLSFISILVLLRVAHKSFILTTPDITCLWTYIVQERKRMKRSTDADANRYRPPYLARHQHMFVGLLTSFIHELEEKYPPSIISSEKKHHHYHLLLTTELIPILKGYRDDIAADFEILQE